MRALSALTLGAALLLALVLPLSRPAGAANDDWANVAKTFGEQFKAKAGVSLKQKRTAVNTLARSKDARAVDLLVGVLDDQDRFAQKLRKEWQQAEDAWQEKTKKLDARVDEKRKRARERGEDSVTLDSEEAEWLGANGQPGKMEEVKRQNDQKYANVLEEESLTLAVLRGMARVMNDLDGPEFDTAAAKATAAAGAAKPDRRLIYVKALGYAKGDKVTTWLETMSKDTNPEVVQTALESLGRQNTARGADILIARLEDPRWQVRASAISGLSMFRNGAVVAKVMDALIERAKKEEGVLQRNFFVGMARIVQESVPATIEAWESWWKANRDDLVKKFTEREGNGLPLEEDPQDVLIETHQGSSSFYGITTDSKHIIYVVDVSGSMSADSKDPGKENADPDAKKRIDIAREELKKAVQSLTSKEGDERGEATFNIVIFATTVTVYKPGVMITASKANKDAAVKWIDENVVPTDLTNIFDAIEQAFNIVSATNDAKNLKKGADTIFLMTDGAPNRGKFFEPDLILKEVKRMNATRKLTIHTIGVGEGHNAPLLQTLAAQNGGQYIAR